MNWLPQNIFVLLYFPFEENILQVRFFTLFCTLWIQPMSIFKLLFSRQQLYFSMWSCTYHNRSNVGFSKLLLNSLLYFMNIINTSKTRRFDLSVGLSSLRMFRDSNYSILTSNGWFCRTLFLHHNFDKEFFNKWVLLLLLVLLQFTDI